MQPNYDLDLIHKAKIMGSLAHYGQKYGIYDYTSHLEVVNRNLHEKYTPQSSDILAAAYLHDSIEDTVVTREDIEKFINPRVAELVWRVTDEPGDNRKERKAKTYPKIAADPEAVALKLADRLANVSYSTENYSKLKMYIGEHHDFMRGLESGCTILHHNLIKGINFYIYDWPNIMCVVVPCDKCKSSVRLCGRDAQNKEYNQDLGKWVYYACEKCFYEDGTTFLGEECVEMTNLEFLRISSK
jgi:hypothetical protein